MDYAVLGTLQARIPDWVAFPFSQSSWPWDRAQVSSIAGGFFTSWATRKAQDLKILLKILKVPANTLFFFFLTLNFLFCIGVYRPINTVVMVSGRHQRDSPRRTHASFLPQTPLPSRLPHDIEQSSLWWTAGPCGFSMLNTTVCPSQTPWLSLPPSFFPSNHKFLL